MQTAERNRYRVLAVHRELPNVSYELERADTPHEALRIAAGAAALTYANALYRHHAEDTKTGEVLTGEVRIQAKQTREQAARRRPRRVRTTTGRNAPNKRSPAM